ncbi:transposase [Parahaliea aestuarii]|uniref:Transposase n=1 Tax=Parahaliea aestuarii TaxID=1852021 RepID=A0A5C8ZZA0_9GAMM|nr:transposase [Parahaliea aestuarii]TXS92551.1 transposase [Parahaliea aestuarii]
MGQTRKRNYDRYTLAYKLQAVRLASYPDVKTKDVAESLGLHPVMLYRWCMEHRRGELRENKNMKPSKPSPKRRPDRADPRVENDAELLKAKKRIQQLEKALKNRDEELELLKKAQRFFEKRKK